VATAELELDVEALYEAVDRRRRHLRMRRKEVAAELGIAPYTISFWGAGGGIGADAVLRSCVWLGSDIQRLREEGRREQLMIDENWHPLGNIGGSPCFF
jgi:hypothetical protein